MKKIRKVRLIKVVAVTFAMTLLNVTNVVALDEKVPAEAEKGKALFEGSKRLTNGGPSCISCHSVRNGNVIPGGLLAVALTDAYEKYSVGLSAWLGNPNIPAMEASYQNNPMTEEERADLANFLKYVNADKENHETQQGYTMMLAGGGAGVFVLLVLISLIWMKRKRKMVKEDVFRRQSGAYDAKY